jgi:hypothetical protein
MKTPETINGRNGVSPEARRKDGRSYFDFCVAHSADPALLRRGSAGNQGLRGTQSGTAAAPSSRLLTFWPFR